MNKEDTEKRLENELGEFYESSQSFYFNDNLRFLIFNLLGSNWEIIPNKILDVITKHNLAIELLEFRSNGFYLIVENLNKNKKDE